MEQQRRSGAVFFDILRWEIGKEASPGATGWARGQVAHRRPRGGSRAWDNSARSVRNRPIMPGGPTWKFRQIQVNSTTKTTGPEFDSVVSRPAGGFTQVVDFHDISRYFTSFSLSVLAGMASRHWYVAVGRALPRRPNFALGLAMFPFGTRWRAFPGKSHGRAAALPYHC
jgi:hypothetical protein